MTTKKQLEEFFDKVDTDHSGFLEKDELIKLMKGSGYSQKDAEKYLRAWDSSGDGKVSKKEFLEGMGLVPENQQAEARMRRTFRSMDLDGSGTLDKKELKAVFEELGEKISDAEMDKIVKAIDKDGDGKISYEEFIKVFSSK